MVDCNHSGGPRRREGRVAEYSIPLRTLPCTGNSEARWRGLAAATVNDIASFLFLRLLRLKQQNRAGREGQGNHRLPVGLGRFYWCA